MTGSEDDPYVFTAADFNFSDPVEGHSFFAVQITTLPASGDILLNGAPVLAGDFIAVSAINAGMLTFQPDPDGFGSPYTTFTFRVQDGGGVLNGGVDTDPTPRTMTINVTPDNLAPEVDLNGAGAGLDAAVSYTEDAAGVSIGSGITVSDPNEVTGDLIESATITLTDRGGGRRAHRHPAAAGRDHRRHHQSGRPDRGHPVGRRPRPRIMPRRSPRCSIRPPTKTIRPWAAPIRRGRSRSRSMTAC